MLILIQYHVILIEHIHHLERHLWNSFIFFPWYLPFIMSLHCGLITSKWRLGGNSSIAQLNEIQKFSLHLYWGLKNTAGTVAWAQKICVLQVHVGMEILLFVLTFDSTESVYSSLTLPAIQRLWWFCCSICFVYWHCFAL